MKRFATGSISVATALSVAGGLILGVATSIVWVTNSITSAVAPVQAQTQANTTDIAVVKDELKDLSWVKAALEANGIKPNASFFKQPTQ